MDEGAFHTIKNYIHKYIAFFLNPDLKEEFNICKKKKHVNKCPRKNGITNKLYSLLENVRSTFYHWLNAQRSKPMTSII